MPKHANTFFLDSFCWEALKSWIFTGQSKIYISTLIHDFWRSPFRDEETAVIFWDSGWFDIFFGLFGTWKNLNRFAQPRRKTSKKKSTSWKNTLWKCFSTPSKNIIQPSILCKSLLFLGKKPLGKPFWVWTPFQNDAWYRSSWAFSRSHLCGWRII